MNPPKEWQTGDIIAAGGSGDGQTLTVAVTLPLAFWEELTANLASFDRDARDDPKLPDLTLQKRLSAFFNLEIAEWEARGHVRTDRHGDLDDGVPF